MNTMINQKEYKSKYMAGSLRYNNDPYNRDEKHYLDRAKAIYGMYCSDIMGIGFGGVTVGGRTYDELRAYGRSMQPVSKYRDILDPLVKGADGKKYRRYNISWDINRPLAKYRNILKSKITGLRLEIVTEANDPFATHEKESIVAKMKFMAEQKTREFVQNTGYQLQEMEAVQGFEGPKDVDLYQQLGGIMLSTEMMMKDSIDLTLNESRWSAINDIFAEDLIDLNAFAGHIYTDQTSGRVMVEYVDPSRLIIDPSVYPDHHDAGTVGFVATKKISQIRQQLGGLTPELEQKMRNAASNYRQYYNNSGYFSTSGSRLSYSRGGANPLADIDDVSVDVMTLYFVDVDPRRYVKRRNKAHGNLVYDQVGPESTAKGAEIEEATIHSLFKVNWIVGSDVVFDYGVADDIVRAGHPGSKRVIPNIFCYIGQDPSFVEQCIGHIDDINIAVFKRRNLISKLPPGPRMILDMAGLKDSVQIGNDEFSILENLKNYSIDGVLLVESEGEYAMPGQENSGSAKRPITFQESGILEDISILTAEVNEGIRGIQHVTGFNPTTDGTGAAPDMLKHVAEAASQATNAANAPLVKAWINTYERMCDLIARKWQLRVLAGDVDYNKLPISGTIIEQAKLTKEMFYRDWNIFVKVDDSMTKDMLLQDLMSKKEIIPSEVYYQIFMSIQQHDLKRAQVVLSRFVDQSKKEEHQRMLEIQKAQAEGNAMAAKATQEAEMFTEEAKSKFKKEEMILDKNIKLELMKEEYRLKALSGQS